MVTVSHIVKRMVNERPMLQEALRQGIVNYASLAEKIRKKVESEFGGDVNESAIVMALRRYVEDLEDVPVHGISLFFESGIVMKSGIVDISVAKSATLAANLARLYGAVDFRKGDILNLIHGNNEVSIITNERSIAKVLRILHGENILMKERGLVSVTLSISKEHLYAPGVIFEAVRKLAWDNVNIFEIVSTTTELIFIVGGKDATRAYGSLQELVSSRNADS
ncbi:hypothetical protein HYU11_04975 [Candidatus Woesearchaeota archaeon]|nr:hypothetical protein [Candidatus Woesearchaeota archaeon]